MNSTPSDPHFSPDQKAAHEFLSELRSRITLQHLPYQHGMEPQALESLVGVFDHAREAMKKNPGCAGFAEQVTRMLNLVIRPMTAKWHRPCAEGRLNSRDGGDEFRADLAVVQIKLRRYAQEFHRMAYKTEAQDHRTPPAMSPAALAHCLSPLKYGVPKGMLMKEDSAGSEQLRRDLNAREAEAVQHKRQATNSDENWRQTPMDKDAAGLALSGGGIRSASFGLGVVQVLAERGLLEQIDFLSTVSGGGYTGSFLTSRLGTGTPFADVGRPRGPDPAPIGVLRQRAKFLTARSLWTSWSMVIQTLAGVFLNWQVPLLVVIVLAAACSWAKLLDVPPQAWAQRTGWCLLAASVSALPYFFALRKRAVTIKAFGWVFAVISMLFVASALTWGLSQAFHGMFAKNRSLPEWRTWPQLWAALTEVGGKWTFRLMGAGGVAALVPMILRFVPVVENPKMRQTVLKIALWLAGFIVPLLGLAAFLLLYCAGRVTVFPESPVWGGQTILWTAAAVFALIALFVLNINLTAPHRIYRDGLDTAFVQESEAASEIEPVPMAEINGEKRAPYHLINAAVNLPTSSKPGLRDRQCDFFLFSKYFTGSPVVGYRPTPEWRMNGKPVDLGTAMAISGAAFSSSMGLGSKPTLRALLTFLNVRLGFWIRRPDVPGKWGLPIMKHPGFACLLREMTGLGMDEKKRWLNLSDGGHIENMAVYELLRRRCKFIICVDGECDSGFDFEGLMTLVRHAQIDFGIRIEPPVEPLRPDPVTRHSRAHSLLTRIHYPAAGGEEAGTGLLLYLKLSVTGNEPGLIERYRRLHPVFPHETTLDQFFDEEQFEAYRQLGVHIAESLFLRCLLHDPHAEAAPPPAADCAETSKWTIHSWFSRLAANLLQPEPCDPL